MATIFRRSLALALVVASASAWSQSPRPSLSPDLAFKTAGVVHTLVREADGAVVIGGRFVSINGVPRRNLARLLPDGRLDLAWNIEADGEVEHLALGPGGEIYVAGTFTHLGNQPIASLARLVGAQGGRVDATWRPAFEDVPTILDVDVGDDGAVYAAGSLPMAGRSRDAVRLSSIDAELDQRWSVELDSESDIVTTIEVDGASVYLAGAFSAVNGTSRDGVARVDVSHGQVDSWAPRIGGSVEVIAVDRSGNVFLGGLISFVEGEERRGMAKLDDDGRLLPWDARLTADAGGVTVSDLLLDGTSDSLIVTGRFDSAASLRRRDVARVSVSSGTVDADWDPRIENAFDPESARVLAASLQGTDGGVVIGGQFLQASGDVRMSLASFGADGTVGARIDAEADASVDRLVVDSAGGLIVAGDFDTIDGVLRRRLARITAEGLLDPDWVAHVEGGSSEVLALAMDGESVVVGGHFARIGGAQVPFLGTVSARTGEVLPWRPMPDQRVTALAADEGHVYVAGDFESLGGHPVRHLARFSSGSPDPWSSAGGAPFHELIVRAGSLYGAGPGIVKMDSATGQVVDAFHFGVAVRTLVAADDGALYAGGQFTAIDAAGNTHHGLVRIDAHDGRVDTEWNAGLADDAVVDALALDVFGALYVGGTFAEVRGEARAHLARIPPPPGRALGRWNPSPETAAFPERPVRALAFLPDRRLAVGGRFSGIGGEGHASLAALPTPVVLEIEPASLADAVVGVPLELSFIASGGEPPYRFALTGALPPGLEWSADTGTISGTPAATGRYRLVAEAADSTPHSDMGPLHGARAYELRVRRTQAIAWVDPPARMTFGESVVLRTESTSGLSVEVESTTPHLCAITGVNVLVATAAGSCRLIASQDGDEEHLPSSPIEHLVEIEPAEQAPLLVEAPARLAIGERGPVRVTGGSGEGAVTIESTTPQQCAIDGTQVVALAAGRCNLVARKAADANHRPAEATAGFDVAAPSGALLKDGFEGA